MYVIHYNQHKGGTDKKDQLLPVYLVERKRMKKWYMKFRRLLSAMVNGSLNIYRHNTGHSVHCLKFCIDLVEGLLVKYSVQHKVSSHLCDDNTVKRQTECHFPRIIHSTERRVNQQDSAVSVTREERLYIIVWSVRLMDVLRASIQGILLR